MKRIIISLFGLVLLVAALSGHAFAASPDIYYEVQEGKVFFLNGPTNSSEVIGAVAASFETVNTGNHDTVFGKDQYHVYCENKILKGADPDTFEYLNILYSKDNNNVYWLDTPIADANASSFQVLSSELIVGNSGTAYAKDKNHVYFLWGVLDDADPATFVYHGGSVFASDKNHVYVSGNIWKDVDPQTFRVEGEFFADKNYVYRSDGSIIYKSENFSNGIGGPILTATPPIAKPKKPVMDVTPPTDLAKNDPDYETVMQAKKNGWLKGYPDGTVRMDQRISRAEFIKIAEEAFDSSNFDQEWAPAGITPVPLPPGVRFVCPDTPADKWYSAAMYSAKEAGIIKGYPEEGVSAEKWNCRPGQHINKVEALKIVLSLSRLDPYAVDAKYYNQYADTSYREWYSPYTAYARLTKLLDHDVHYRLHPGDPLTRGEMIVITAEMRNRILKGKVYSIPPSFYPDEAVYELKDTYGSENPEPAQPPTPPATTKQTDVITRAELAKVIVEAFNLPIKEDSKAATAFSDVEPSAWYARYVRALVDAGYIAGFEETLKPLSRPLQLGDTSEDVAVLQTVLKKKGFYGGYLSGNFDQATKDALLSLQNIRHLNENGAVGEGTIAEINKIIRNGKQTARLFRPDETTTQGEALKAILDTVGVELGAYEDGVVSHDVWFNKYYAYIMEVNSIVNYFRADALITPDEAAMMIAHIQSFEINKGIALKSNILNDNEIMWTWSGDTVALSDRFQLWSGDKMLVETDKKQYTTRITECDRYQAVKLRAHLKPGSDHPRAGEWSLFSAENEQYVGEKGLLTEKDVVNTLFECLENKKATTVSAYLELEKEYQPDANVSLAKAAYFLTGMMDRDLPPESPLKYYPHLFYVMNFINSAQFDANMYLTDPMPKAILYKLISKTNQTDNFDALFKDAVEDLLRRMIGDATI